MLSFRSCSTGVVLAAALLAGCGSTPKELIDSGSAGWHSWLVHQCQERRIAIQGKRSHSRSVPAARTSPA